MTGNFIRTSTSTLCLVACLLSVGCIAARQETVKDIQLEMRLDRQADDLTGEFDAKLQTTVAKAMEQQRTEFVEVLQESDFGAKSGDIAGIPSWVWMLLGGGAFGGVGIAADRGIKSRAEKKRNGNDDAAGD